VVTLQLISGCGLTLFVLCLLHILTALSAFILAPILVRIILIHLLLVARRKVSYAIRKEQVFCAFKCTICGDCNGSRLSGRSNHRETAATHVSHYVGNSRG
jgi:hypothetical protein